jgi:hypothetical protein
MPLVTDFVTARAPHKGRPHPNRLGSRTRATVSGPALPLRRAWNELFTALVLYQGTASGCFSGALISRMPRDKRVAAYRLGPELMPKA